MCVKGVMEKIKVESMVHQEGQLNWRWGLRWVFCCEENALRVVVRAVCMDVLGSLRSEG